MSILDENESLLFQLHKAQGLSSDRNNDSIIGHLRLTIKSNKKLEILLRKKDLSC
jgi:hypothetical protein